MTWRFRGRGRKFEQEATEETENPMLRCRGFLLFNQPPDPGNEYVQGDGILIR